MLKSYKDRTIPSDRELEVYRNLTQKCFSIRNSSSKLVVAHGNGFVVHNARFVVSEAGRQRVIREKCKNVHAYVVGRGIKEVDMDISNMIEITYNPYHLPYFFSANTKGKIEEAEFVYFVDGKAYVPEDTIFKKDMSLNVGGKEYTIKNTPYYEMKTEEERYIDASTAFKLAMIRDLMVAGEIPSVVDFDDVADLEF